VRLSQPALVSGVMGIGIAIALVAAANLPWADSSPTANASPVAGGSPVTSASPAAGERPLSSPRPAPSAPPTGTPASVATPEPAVTPGAADSDDTLESQRYTLRSSLDWAASRLDTEETLVWRNNGNTDVAHIDLSVEPRAMGILSLGEVTVDGRPADTRWTTGTNLRVDLGDARLPGSTVTVDIAFSLRLDSTGLFAQRMSIRGGILSLSEWFPIWSREHDFVPLGDPQVSYTADSITFELTSTSPLGIDAVAASGELAGGTTDSHWLFRATDVRDLAVAVSPRYRVAEATISCTQQDQAFETLVRSYGVGGSQKELLALGIAALERYGEWYGCYPWPEFSLAEVGVGGDWGVEGPNIVFVGRDQTASARVVWHEVAHQWWYSLVGTDQISEPWLDEGLAQFSMLHGLGLPINASCSRKAIDRPSTSWVRADGSGHWGGCQGYDETVYRRGAEFIDRVRKAMGEEPFFSTLRAFIADHEYGLVTAADLLAALRAGTDADLGPLISAYFRR
jgi:hypothetical protein